MGFRVAIVTCEVIGCEYGLEMLFVTCWDYVEGRGVIISE